jgi:hypothetical protein
MKPKGIFCLEGDWDHDLRRRTTMLPLLDLLERSHDPEIPSIRRDIGTEQELSYYLQKWVQKRYSNYPILCIGCHGDSKGIIYVGDRNKYVDLTWLERHLRGKCARRVIYFGSCSTLNAHGKRLRGFLRRTGAAAVCGYTENVDWLTSAAFEIILFSSFQRRTFKPRGLRAIESDITREASGLAKKLGFRIVIADGQTA